MPLINQTINESSCLREPYRGQICRQALLSRQSCIDNSSTGNSEVGEVYISALGKQAVLEQLASRLFLGLQSLPADTQCQLAVLLPFLCSVMFVLCDSNGNLNLPSSGECIAITEFINEQELLLDLVSISNGAGVQLPHCESLPDFTRDCSGNPYMQLYFQL